MACVWVDAWDGASRMKEGAERIRIVQPPVDRALEGSSAWLRVAREMAAQKAGTAAPPADAGRKVIAESFARARKTEPASAPLAAEPSRKVGSDPTL